MTDVAAFLDGLRRQRDKYREMAAVVEGQKQVLSGADLDALMALVGRKRALMAEIEELERGLLPVKECWAELRPQVDPATLREVEETVEETRSVLATLVRLEDEGRRVMEEQRDSAARELQGRMGRMKASRAYGGPSSERKG